MLTSTRRHLNVSHLPNMKRFLLGWMSPCVLIQANYLTSTNTYCKLTFTILPKAARVIDRSSLLATMESALSAAGFVCDGKVYSGDHGSFGFSPPSLNTYPPSLSVASSTSTMEQTSASTMANCSLQSLPTMRTPSSNQSVSV